MSFQKTDIYGFSAFVSQQNVGEMVKRLEYELVMQSPDLQNETLNKMIYYRGMEDDKLFKPAQGGFDVNAPNFFIQKIRAIYYLILVCVVEQPDKFKSLKASFTNIEDLKKSTDMFSSKILITRYSTLDGIQKMRKAFDLLRLSMYRNDKISKNKKKYFAEFMQLMKYSSRSTTNRISSTINKFPVIDQILIDTLIDIIGHETLDDNLNIEKSINEKLGLKCEFQMFREFTVEGVSIKVIDNGFRIVQNEGFAADLSKQITKWLKQNGKDEIDIQDLLDVSRVDQFQEDIFTKMDDTYILELDPFNQTQLNVSIEDSPHTSPLIKHQSNLSENSANTHHTQTHDKISVNSIYAKRKETSTTASSQNNTSNNTNIINNTDQPIKYTTYQNYTENRSGFNLGEPLVIYKRQQTKQLSKQNVQKLAQMTQLQREAQKQKQKKMDKVIRNIIYSKDPNNQNSVSKVEYQVSENIDRAPEIKRQTFYYQPKIISQNYSKSQMCIPPPSSEHQEISPSRMGTRVTNYPSRPSPLSFKTLVSTLQKKEYIPSTKAYPVTAQNSTITTPVTYRQRINYPKRAFQINREQIQNPNSALLSKQRQYIFKTKPYTTNYETFNQTFVKNRQESKNGGTSRIELGNQRTYKNFKELGAFMSKNQEPQKRFVSRVYNPV